MHNSPELSVVMSVYNGQQYLEESIKSILNQSYSNFEFIIINDGSTDTSGEIIEKYAMRDKRIVVIHQQNAGLARSLNIGIKKAKGKYIARQDADDVSFPTRFKKQIEFYKQNPGAVLCGTWFLEVNEDQGAKLRKYPVNDKELRKDLKYVNHFCHPSVVFLKDAFHKAGQYDVDFTTSQDFELWIRLAREGLIANLPEVLLKKRIGFSMTLSWHKRSQKYLMAKKVISKHFESWKEINIIKFIKYYLPKLVYGYMPVWFLKLLRKIRYNEPI